MQLNKISFLGGRISYDVAEGCELVGLYILYQLNKYARCRTLVFLSRQWLAVMYKRSDSQFEHIKKSISKAKCLVGDGEVK